jgi:hypothetical protein
MGFELRGSHVSHAEVFIIESLTLNDERRQRFEGRIISQILALSGKKCEYYYVRTRRELVAMLKQFSSSNYRYLHLSCHGDDSSMATTFDAISFSEFGPLIKPYLRKRRLFVSACSMTNRSLAESIMPGSGCYSILGPDQDIRFSDDGCDGNNMIRVCRVPRPQKKSQSQNSEKIDHASVL